MSLPCGHKSNTETVAQYRKRCGPRPLGMIGKISESEIKTIHKILTQYGRSAKDATDMIKKNYKKVVQKFRGSSSRDKAIALLGYSLLGENNKTELMKLYNKAFKMMPGSSKQKEIMKKISDLRKKLKMDEAPRKPRKKGQHRNSPNHSDLYTDENPKGTIKGLKFATVQDAEKSVSKIRSSGKSHAHKIQAAVAMEQRAKEMGKSSQAAVYRKFINKMKKKTKQKNEGWSDKYKKSIDCNNPKGFSQKAHCAGRNKQESKMGLKLEELVGKKLTEAQFDEAAGEKDACYHKVKARYDVWPSAYASGALVKCRKVGAKNWGNKSKKESVNEDQCLCEACWKGYTKKGMKKMFGKMYPNCVKNESYDIWNEDGSFGYTMGGLIEAEYQGRKVKLGKPMQGDSKKFKVYVKNDKGNVVKVNFGQGGDAKGGTMRIRKSNPKARKSFRARHNCDTPGPRHKARYWSCKKW